MKKTAVQMVFAVLLVTSLLFTASGCVLTRVSDSTPTDTESDDINSYLKKIVGTAPVGVMSASSNLEMYMRLDGFEGEAQSAGYANQIVVKDVTLGTQNEATYSGRGASSFQKFVFTHVVDKATPKLQRACMIENYINTATLSVCQSVAGRMTEVFRVDLENCIVTKATVEYDELTGNLVETVELAAAKETWSATTIKPDSTVGGTTEESYDLIRMQ